MRRALIALLAISAPLSSFAQQLDFRVDLQTADVWRGRNLVDDFVAKGSVFARQGPFSFFVTGRMELTNTNSYPPTADPSGKITAVRGGAFFTLPYDRRSSLKLGALVHQYPGTGQHQTTELYYALVPNAEDGMGLEVMQDIDQVNGFYARAWYDYSFSSGYLQRDQTFQKMKLSAWVGYGNNKHNAYYYFADTSVLTDFGVRLGSTFLVGGLPVTPWVEFTTLLDPDLLKGTHDRWNLYSGVSVGFRF